MENEENNKGAKEKPRHHLGKTPRYCRIFVLLNKGAALAYRTRRAYLVGHYALMKLISWNVNGLRAVHKKGLFVPFIEKYKPDIFCLQETKAEQGQAEVDLPEYEEYWNSAKKKGYSGTAIFTRIKPLQVLLGLPEDIAHKYKLNGDGYGDPNTEGRVIAAEFTISISLILTPQTQTRPLASHAPPQALGPGIFGISQTFRQEKARDFLRRPQCRTHRG